MDCKRAQRIYMETDHAAEFGEEFPKLYKLATHHVDNCGECTKFFLKIFDKQEEKYNEEKGGS